LLPPVPALVLNEQLIGWLIILRPGSESELGALSGSAEKTDRLAILLMHHGLEELRRLPDLLPFSLMKLTELTVIGRGILS
jgi:hypothetical protein